MTNLNDRYAEGSDADVMASMVAQFGACKCSADDCTEDTCGLCAALDPEWPCPTADADPDHAAIIQEADNG